MNAFQILKKDQEKVVKIFERINPRTERAVKTRKQLFERIKTKFDTHADIKKEEEEMFKKTKMF